MSYAEEQNEPVPWMEPSAWVAAIENISKPRARGVGAPSIVSATWIPRYPGETDEAWLARRKSFVTIAAEHGAHVPPAVKILL